MVLCSPGRRRAASMSSTREPPNASASARLHAVVVFPSSGWLLVKAMMGAGGGPLGKTRAWRDGDDARRLCAAGEYERRAERSKRFTEIVRAGLGQYGDTLPANRRHHAE